MLQVRNRFEGTVKGISRSFIWMAATAICGFWLAPSTATASDTIRLVVDGVIDVIELANPDFQLPLTPDDIGLADGDPLQLILEFDRTLTQPLGNASPLDRIELLVQGESFSPLPSDPPQGLFSVGTSGASGLFFQVLPPVLSGTLNDVDVLTGVITANPFVLDFTTGDIGFDGESFPSDLAITDLAEPAITGTLGFGIAADDLLGFGFGPAYTFEVTGLSVTAIPEPATVCLVALSGLGCLAFTRQNRASLASR